MSKENLIQSGYDISCFVLESRLLLAGDLVKDPNDPGDSDPSTLVGHAPLIPQALIQGSFSSSNEFSVDGKNLTTFTVPVNEWTPSNGGVIAALTYTISGTAIIQSEVWTISDIMSYDGSVWSNNPDLLVMQGDVIVTGIGLLGYPSVQQIRAMVYLSYSASEYSAASGGIVSVPKSVSTTISLVVIENVGEPNFTLFPYIYVDPNTTYTHKLSDFPYYDDEASTGDRIESFNIQYIDPGVKAYYGGQKITSLAFSRISELSKVEFSFNHTSSDQLFIAKYYINDSGSNQSQLGTITFVARSLNNITLSLSRTFIETPPHTLNPSDSLFLTEGYIIGNTGGIQPAFSSGPVSVYDYSPPSVPSVQVKNNIIIVLGPLYTNADTTWGLTPANGVFLVDRLYQIPLILRLGTNTYYASMQLTVTNTSNLPPTNINLVDTKFYENELIVGEFTANDPENDPLTYSLNSHNSIFGINNNTLTLHNLLNYEAIISYMWTLNVSVSDGFHTVTYNPTVTILDVNEPPFLGNSLIETVTEGSVTIGQFLHDIQATDPENDVLSYDVLDVKVRDPGGIWNTISTNNIFIDLNGSMVVAGSPVGIYKAGSLIRIDYKVTDGVNTITAIQDIEVKAPSNRPITGLSPRSISVKEDTSVGTVIQTLSVQDVDSNDTYLYNIISVSAFNTLTTGSIVTAKQYFSINNDEITLTDQLDFEQYSKFMVTVVVTDRIAGAADITSYTETIEIMVLDVIEKPSSSDLTISLTEDTPLTWTNVIVQFVASANTSSFQSFNIATLPSKGKLTFNGIDVAVGQNIPENQIQQIVYSPNQDVSGGAVDSFLFQVIDSLRVSSSSYRVQFDISAVNDAPTAIQYSPVDLSEKAPTGSEVTTLTAVDPDGSADTHVYTVEGIQQIDPSGVTTTVATNLFTISGDKIIINGRLDITQQSSFIIDVKVTDSGLNNPLMALSFNEKVTLQLTDANDPITAVSPSVTIISETVSAGTSVATFSVTDKDTNDTYTFLIDSISGKNQAGRYVNADANQYLIVSGNELVVNNLLDFEAHEQLIVILKVTDSGLGDPNSISTYLHTFTVNIIDENESDPVSSNVIKSIQEDSTYTFQQNQIPFTDADIGDVFTEFIVETLPSAGTLWLNNSAVQALTTLSVADLGKLEFRPNLNENGNSYATMEFRVVDSVGRSSTLSTITWNVIPVTDPITGAGLDKDTVPEQSTIGYEVGTFSFIDVDVGDTYSLSINDIQKYARGSTISVAAISDFIISKNSNNDIVLLVNNSINYEDTKYYVLDITVDDYGSGSTAILSSVSIVVTITVTDVNDPITAVTPNTVTIPETTPAGQTILSLTIVDEDITDTYKNKIISVSTVDASGQSTVATNQNIFSASGNLIKAGAGLDYEKFVSANIVLVMSDSGQGDPSSISKLTYTVNVVLTDENDEIPTSQNFNIQMIEDSTYTFSSRNLKFTDADANDSLKNVIISSLPVRGSLQLKNIPVSVSQAILGSDLPNLVYTPTADESGSPYTQFGFKVSDQGGNTSKEYTVTVNVSPVNDPPTNIIVSPSTILENENVGTTIGVLITEDPDTNDTFTYQLLSVIRVDKGGSSITLSVNDFSITNDVLISNVKADFEQTDHFEVKIKSTDSGLGVTANIGSIDKVVTVSVVDANDPITDVNPKLIQIDESPPFGSVLITYTVDDQDVQDTYLFNILRVEGIDSQGVVFDVTSLNLLVIQGSKLIAAGDLDYELYESLVIHFEVTDSGLGDPSKISTFTTASTVSLNDINDEIPVSSDLTYTIDEDTTFTFGGTLTIPFSDRDVGDAFTAIIITSLPTNGELKINGIAVTVNQNIAISNLRSLEYIPSANEAGLGYATISFMVVDSGGNNSTGNKIVWDVNDLNDPPTSISLIPEAVSENLPKGTTIGRLTAIDDDANDTHSYQIINAKVVTRAGKTVPLSMSFFKIVGNFLVIDGVANFEVNDKFLIRIRATDAGNLSYEEVKTITILDDNDPITAVKPSILSADEDIPIGTTLATLQVTDEDITDTYSVTIKSIMGLDPTNTSIDVSSYGYISFVGLEMIVSNSLDYEQHTRLTLVVVVSDTANGLAPVSTFSHTIALNINDKNDQIPETQAISFTIQENSTHSFVSSDFPFSDKDTVDRLKAVRIHTLPGKGQLTLRGQQVTAGQIVAAKDLNFLGYTPKIYGFGKNYASVVFSVLDIADNESSAKDIIWDVTPVNNPPLSVSLDNNHIEENQPSGTTVGTLTVEDPDKGDVHTHSIISIVLYNRQGLPTLLPSTAFSINSGVLVANQSFDYERDSRIEIEITSSDAATSINSTLELFVDDSNDPITAVTPKFIIVSESTMPGKEILQLQITDQDVNDQYMATIIGIEARDKTGAVLPQVNLKSPVKMIGTTMIVDNGLDYELSPQILVSIAITDSGFGGTNIVSTYTTEVTVIIVDENDEPPTTQNITVSSPEDVTYTFSETSFPFASIEANDVLKGLVIVSLPINGELSVDGTLVASGQELDINDMNKLMFVSSLNEFGSPYTELVFKVIDSGDNKSTEATATIIVTPVNDAPTDILISQNTVPEEQRGVTVGILSVDDVDVGDTHSFSIVRVEGIDAAGTATPLPTSIFTVTNQQLILNGKVNYEQIQSVQVVVKATDSGLGVPADQLSFEKTLTISIIDQNEAIIAVSPKFAKVSETASLGTKVVELTVTDVDQNDSHSFEITSIVSDTGITVSNSVFSFTGRDLNVNSDLDYETHSVFVVGIRASDSGFGDKTKITTLDTNLTVTIENENDEIPVSSDITFTVNEDETFTMGTMTLAFTDKDAGDRVKGYIIETVPSKGQFLFEGNIIAASTFFSPADWKKIMFVAEQNEFGVDYAFSMVKVVDQADNESVAVKVSWDVEGVNDKPTDILADNDLIMENIAANSAVATLTVVDSDVSDTHTIKILEVQSILAGGSTFSIGLTAFTINGNVLHVQTPVDYETTHFYRIKLIATETSIPQPKSFEKWITFSIQDNNDPITDLLPTTVSVIEGEAVNTLITSFSVIDQDVLDTYSFEILKVEGMDSGGQITDVTGQGYIVVRDKDLLVGSLIDYSIVQKLEVEVKVKDSTSELIRTITVNIIDVNNHNPTSADIEVHLDEDTPFVFMATKIPFADTDINDSLTGIVVKSIVSQGTLMLNNQAITTSQTIDLADIPNITYLPDINYNGKDFFEFLVLDSGSLESDPYTFTFIVDPVNDAPSNIVSDTNQIIEDQPLGTTFATLTVEDVDVGDSHKLSIVNVSSVDISGVVSKRTITDFSLVGTSLVQNILVSYEDIRSVIISVEATDSGLGVSSSILSVIKDLTYTVVNINDPITDVNPKDVTVPESESKGTNIATITVTDEDIQETFTYKIVKVEGMSGTSTVDITADLPYSIENDTIKLIKSLDYETFTENVIVIEVTDSGQGDPATESSFMHTMTVHVTDENDEYPDSKDLTLTVKEDETFTFGTQAIPFTDKDKGDSLSGIEITLLPTDGKLVLNNQIVSTSQTILIADIPNLQYIPDADLWGIAQGVSKFRVLDQNNLASQEYSFIWDVIATNDPITDLEANPQSFPEGTPKNTVIATLSIADIDIPDSHRYDITSVIRNNRDGTTTSLSNNAFTILNDEILIQVSNSYRDHKSFKITIVASDSGLGDVNEISTFTKDLVLTLIDINNPITNITPTQADVSEDEAVGKAVLTLTIEDEDTNDKYTLSITGGEGIDFTGKTTSLTTIPFDFVNEELRITQSLDYETYRSYFLTVSVNDSGLGDPSSVSSLVKTLTITILPVNDEIPVSNDLSFTIDEDTTFSFATNTIPFSDRDANDKLFGLVIAQLPTEGKLVLMGNDINVGDIIKADDISKLSFIPKKNSYGDDNDTTVYRLLDLGNNESILYTVTWNVIPVNDAPTGAKLDPSEIDENSPIATEVGELTAIDIDDNPNQTHSFEVIEAIGYNKKDEATGTSGKFFTVQNNKLLTNQSIDYEKAVYYIIKLRVSDSGLGNPSQIKSTETEITVTVNDINERPEFIDKNSTITVIEGDEIYKPENKYLQNLFVDPEGGEVIVEGISSLSKWPVLKDGKLYGIPDKVDVVEVTVSVADLEGNKETGILTIVVKAFVPPPPLPSSSNGVNSDDYVSEADYSYKSGYSPSGKNLRGLSIEIIKRILGDYGDLNLNGIFVGKNVSDQSIRSGHSSSEIYAGEFEKRLGKILNRSLEAGPYITGGGEGYFYSAFDLVSQRLRGIVNSIDDPWLIKFRFINSVTDLGVNGHASSFSFRSTSQESIVLGKKEDVPDKPFILQDDLDLLFYEDTLAERLKRNREKLAKELSDLSVPDSETIIDDILFKLGKNDLNDNTRSYIQRIIAKADKGNPENIQKIRQVILSILRSVNGQNENAPLGSIENEIVGLLKTLSDTEN